VTARELLASLRRSGIEVSVREDRLRVEAPRGAVTPEIRQRLADRKQELIELLSAPVTWSPESIAAAASFGVPHARLYPFIGKAVDTPAGGGRLLQVFAERAAVLLDHDAERVVYFVPSEIRPPGTAGDVEAADLT
jgi:hypothetical protein